MAKWGKTKKGQPYQKRNKKIDYRFVQKFPPKEMRFSELPKEERHRISSWWFSRDEPNSNMKVNDMGTFPYNLK